MGGAIAEGLAQAGATIAVLSRTSENAERRARRICNDLKAEAIGIQVQASSRDDLQAARHKVLAKWNRDDIVVNATGINSGTPFFLRNGSF